MCNDGGATVAEASISGSCASKVSVKSFSGFINPSDMVAYMKYGGAR